MVNRALLLMFAGGLVSGCIITASEQSRLEEVAQRPVVVAGQGPPHAARPQVREEVEAAAALRHRLVDDPLRLHGVEVLLDTLLLAKCDFLLKSSSAVSEFALYYNPRLHNQSYDFSIPDQPPPPWFHGT